MPSWRQVSLADLGPELGIDLSVPWFDVRDVRFFGGAKGDGSTDDTIAIQQAVSSAAASGGAVHIPSGTYKVTSPITVTGSVRIYGAGRTATTITTSSTTNDVFQVAATNVSISDMTITNSGTPSAGAGVVLQSGSFAEIARCRIAGMYRSFEADSASGWSLVNCYLVNFIQYGAYVQNINTPDSGDQAIIGCTFDTGVAAAGSACIRYESGGGLKVSACKLLHADRGIDLQIVDGATTSVLVVNGCSIEAQTVANVRLGRAGTTGSFSNIVLTGNEFKIGSGLTGIAVAPGASNTTIVGNHMAGAASATGIDLSANPSIVYIGGNTFVAYATGMNVGSSAVGITIGPNNNNGTTTMVSDSGNVAGLRFHATKLGFFNTAPVVKPTVSGAKGSNAALGSLMTALSGLGLVIDSTSA